MSSLDDFPSRKSCCFPPHFDDNHQSQELHSRKSKRGKNLGGYSSIVKKHNANWSHVTPCTRPTQSLFVLAIFGLCFHHDFVCEIQVHFGQNVTSFLTFLSATTKSFPHGLGLSCSFVKSDSCQRATASSRPLIHKSLIQF